MVGEITSLAPLYLLLALVGVACALRTPRARPVLALLLWWELYVVAYTVAQLQEYNWYIPPMLVPLIFFAAYGAGEVVGACRALPGRRGLLAVALCATVALPSVRTNWLQFTAPGDCGAEQARYTGARYAAAYVPRDATIASGSIGMVGWFTDNPIVDYAGLVSPKTLSRYPTPYMYYSLQAVAARGQAAYIFDGLTATAWGWPPAVQRSYHVVARFTHSCNFITDFLLWQRDTPPRPHQTAAAQART
jgi:hypothetical protein